MKKGWHSFCRQTGTFLVLMGGLTTSHALVVSPPRTEVRLEPGTSTQVSLTISNDDKVLVHVEVSKKDWFIPDANKMWTVDRWLNVNGPASFSLKPGASRQVSVWLHCPQEMAGEVVGMVSFLYRSDEPSMVTPMISVSMYVIAAGRETMAGEVQEIVIKKYNEQLTINAIFKATGNIHLRPSGRLLLTDRKGKELATIAIPEGQPAYPGRESIYGGQAPPGVALRKGRYTVKAELAYRDLEFKAERHFKVTSKGEIEMDKQK